MEKFQTKELLFEGLAILIFLIKITNTDEMLDICFEEL